VRGARGALEPLFHDGALVFRMAWIFIDMLATDDLHSANEASSRVSDSRLTVFHDPEHMLGRAMARCLGWKSHVAWDTYFIYPPGALWTEVDMPQPAAWFHQLKDREMWEQTAEGEVGTAEWTHALAEKSEADPGRFRTGVDLHSALEETLKEAVAAKAVSGASARNLGTRMPRSRRPA
jgi:hypothetical protein